MDDARLDRLLGGKADLSVTEREAVLAAVLEKTAPDKRGFGLRWAFAVAAVVILVLPLAWLAVSAPDAGFAVRGAALNPSFTLSCVRAGAPSPCARGDKLSFTVSAAGMGYFAAVAETPDGATLWLFPSTSEGQSAAVPADGVLGDAVVLDGAAGEYVVHGLFSREPLSRAAVREALDTPEKAGPAHVLRRVTVR